MVSVAILDIDGTLVDTNYHHVVAWYRALRDHDLTVPLYRLHRLMGMGGDQLVAEICGDDVESEKGDAVRDAEKGHYQRLIDEVRPLPDARRLLEALKELGYTLILASSAKPEEVDHYLDLLDARDLADAWTTSGDVEATKPEPDLVESALAKAGDADPGDAFMLGDSTWDCEAAGRAGVRAYAVLTGGFSEDDLRDAGAEWAVDSLAAAIDALTSAR